MLQAGLLSLALLASILMASCNKEVKDVKPNTTTSEGDKRLEKRIQDFYGRMKSIHENRGANKNAKTASDVYISVDSAEFLIEATYNYYVGTTDDDSSDVAFHGFSFTGTTTNDSILSESEVSAFMYQIKDSIMAVYDTISYVDKAVLLFDLEIEHETGTNELTFDVNYSISIAANPKPIFSTIPGDTYTAWAVLPTTPCGSTPYYISPLKLSQGTNAYFRGTAFLIHDVNSPSLSSGPTCSDPGAAVVLRQYGINNYKATYGYPPLGTVPSVAGKNFYSQWLNEPMMNFYLGYIPGKINSYLPSGKTFYDFQISLKNPAVSSTLTSFTHQYFYFYGSETEINNSPWRISIVTFLSDH